MRDFYDPYFGKFLLKKSSEIICDSKIEKNLIKKSFTINNKIKIISPGVNTKKIEKSTKFDFEGKLILYVGRLEHYKNIHLIIRSFEHLPPDFFLYIIGNGNYKSELVKLINKLNLSNRIKILSNVTDNDLYKWLKTCNILVNLSNLEAFGITIIEGLAAGKPVIVNNKGGLAELANKFKGFVFPVDLNKESIKSLADLFISQSSNNNINPDLKEYDWETISSQFKKTYLKRR